MAKRGSLTDIVAKKAPAAPADTSAPAEAASAQDAEGRRGMTLRLRPDAWRQLKIAAVERGVPAHDLIVEALNGWFQQHGKPPIA